MDIMNKNTLATIIIAGSMLATPLFASNFFHTLMPGKQSVHSATNLHAKPLAKHESQNYTDFSGSWAGDCSFADGNETPMTVTIENDDTYFDMDGEELKIGPLQTKSSSDNLSAEFEHTSLEWSNDMSMLIIKSVYFDKVHSLYPHNESNPMMAIIGQFALSLNNEQLVIKGQAIGFIDLEQKSGLSNITCTLNKK
jgi:hypothetical protein